MINLRDVAARAWLRLTRGNLGRRLRKSLGDAPSAEGSGCNLEQTDHPNAPREGSPLGTRTSSLIPCAAAQALANSVSLPLQTLDLNLLRIQCRRKQRQQQQAASKSAASLPQLQDVPSCLLDRLHGHNCPALHPRLGEMRMQRTEISGVQSISPSAPSRRFQNQASTQNRCDQWMGQIYSCSQLSWELHTS
nr:uncharacterized protein LOC110363772 [Columba livia]